MCRSRARGRSDRHVVEIYGRGEVAPLLRFVEHFRLGVPPVERDARPRCLERLLDRVRQIFRVGRDNADFTTRRLRARCDRESQTGDGEKNPTKPARMWPLLDVLSATVAIPAVDPRQY